MSSCTRLLTAYMVKAIPALSNLLRATNIRSMGCWTTRLQTVLWKMVHRKAC